MFKEAHVVNGETFLAKPLGFVRTESESKNSKKSKGEPPNGKFPTNESKLEIKQVVQIKV